MTVLAKRNAALLWPLRLAVVVATASRLACANRYADMDQILLPVLGAGDTEAVSDGPPIKWRYYSSAAPLQAWVRKKEPVPSRVHHPVVIVPGLINSKLEYRNLNTSHSWKMAWPTANPQRVKRLLSMTWDDVYKVGRNAPGITIRTLGGSTGFAAIDWIPQVQALLTALEQVGYHKDVSVIGHPYDWRQSINFWMEHSFPVLVAEIERAVKRFSQKAVITGYSGGSPYIHAFLEWAGPDWATRNVEAFVSYAGSFGGSVQSLQSVLHGAFSSMVAKGDCPACTPPKLQTTLAPWLLDKVFNFAGELGLYGAVDVPFTDATKTAPGIYFNMPKVDYSHSPPFDPLVAVVKRSNGSQESYHASEISSLLLAYGNAEGAQIIRYLLTKPTTTDIRVPIHCVVEDNTITPEVLQITEEEGVLKVASVTFGDGDGTVNKKNSLDACGRWSSAVKSYTLRNNRHANSALAPAGLAILVAVATNDKDTWFKWKPPGSPGAFDTGITPMDKRFSPNA